MFSLTIHRPAAVATLEIRSMQVVVVLKRGIRLAIAILACAVLSTSDAGAQQSPTPDARSMQLKQVFDGVASRYRITSGLGQKQQVLPLYDGPVMHWLSLDGTTGIYYGSVFVWTRLGRPDVIGTFFTSQGDKERISVCQELYSFSSEQLAVRSGNGKAWRPAPSETMRVIPGAPAPATTEQARRLQIRMMARHFSGRMNRRGVGHPLRMLPRPIIQYSSDDPQILSGAVLVLVAYTTDPDILLLIEARKTGEGPKWFYQPARFSDKSLWLTYQNKDIWTSLRQGHGTTKPHPPDLQYNVDNVTVDAPLARVDGESNKTPQQ